MALLTYHLSPWVDKAAAVARSLAVPSLVLCAVAALGAFGVVNVVGFVLWVAFVAALCVVHHYRYLTPLLWRDLEEAQEINDDLSIKRWKMRSERNLARRQRDEAHAQSVENYNRAIFSEHLVLNAERQLVNQAALQSKIRDLDSERRRALDMKEAHEMDAEGWRAEVDRLTGEVQHATAVLDEIGPAAFAVMARAASEGMALRESLEATHGRIQLLTPIVNQHGTTADRRAHFEALTLSEIDTPPEAAN